MLGVPVLAGSCAYAVSEAAAWRGSLERKPRGARKFYSVLGIAMIIGLAIDYVGFNALKMLFWAAVVIRREPSDEASAVPAIRRPMKASVTPSMTGMNPGPIRASVPIL